MSVCNRVILCVNLQLVSAPSYNYDPYSETTVWLQVAPCRPCGVFLTHNLAESSVTFEPSANAQQEKVKASELHYRGLFEATEDGILALDAETRQITDANPSLCELLDYSRAELLGKELWEIGLFQDQEQSQAAFRKLQTKGGIRYEDLPLETRGGKRREVEFVSKVYQEGAQQVVLCIIRDIHERKQMLLLFLAVEHGFRLATEQGTRAEISPR